MRITINDQKNLFLLIDEHSCDIYVCNLTERNKYKLFFEINMPINQLKLLYSIETAKKTNNYVIFTQEEQLIYNEMLPEVKK